MGSCAYVMCIYRDASWPLNSGAYMFAFKLAHTSQTESIAINDAFTFRCRSVSSHAPTEEHCCKGKVLPSGAQGELQRAMEDALANAKREAQEQANQLAAK